MGLTSTVAELARSTMDRVQDPDGIFWKRENEVYSAIVEGISELMLMIGRPLIQYNTIVTLTPNTVWQPMPSGVLAITNIQSAGSLLWKTSLHSLDYLQASWRGDWESDRATLPLRWAPLGLTTFIVHPAPTQPIQVTLAGVTYPVTSTWPFDGTQTSPWHKEVDDALEMYAASYLRIKDLGDDMLEGQQIYKAFQTIGQRLSMIEDRKDDLVWSASFGARTAPSQVSKR